MFSYFKQTKKISSLPIIIFTFLVPRKYQLDNSGDHYHTLYFYHQSNACTVEFLLPVHCCLPIDEVCENGRSSYNLSTLMT